MGYEFIHLGQWIQGNTGGGNEVRERYISTTPLNPSDTPSSQGFWQWCRARARAAEYPAGASASGSTIAGQKFSNEVPAALLR
jgi:hypothetical protein